MKRGFLNNKKAKNTVLYPDPSKDATQVATSSITAEKREVQTVNPAVESFLTAIFVFRNRNEIILGQGRE
jgi:hypothetical protein